MSHQQYNLKRGRGKGRGGTEEAGVKTGMNQYHYRRKITENDMFPVELIGACAISAPNCSTTLFRFVLSFFQDGA